MMDKSLARKTIITQYTVILFAMLVTNTSSSDGLCKCSCLKDGKPECASRGDKECNDVCVERCLIGEHTMYENGICIDIQNCTCQNNEPYVPICAINPLRCRKETFLNLRDMHCYNNCKEEVFEYIHDGICELNPYQFPPEGCLPGGCGGC